MLSELKAEKVQPEGVNVERCLSYKDIGKLVEHAQVGAVQFTMAFLLVGPPDFTYNSGFGDLGRERNPDGL